MHNKKAVVSKIPHSQPLGPNVFLQIDPKGENEVDNDRRAKREEGGIDEIDANYTRRDAHFLAEIGANSKYPRFYELS